ncbi:hypothetical protein QTO34_004868 [Cnephaeus nilssonii]|uniref:PHD-type domain-containing protein n=1 Tax=Cnephaeus nilssonii TaxID=3371016 RepID=A0AA40HQ25_CNENI|nr:hypothetical protein QTO34_004868 [Eptesicus nilssonii]
MFISALINCRICVECGTRSSSQWHHNCLVCDSCYQQRDNLCPFCGKCYNPELQKDMLHCNMCKRWIHLECDKPTDQELDSQFKEEYICTYCKHLAAAEMDALQPGDGVEMADITAESSQDKMHPELENRISHAVDNEKVEMSSKVMHTCDEDQNENKMDVMGNVDILAHPATAQEELKLLEEPKMVASAEESRPPNSILDSITVPPETLVSPYTGFHKDEKEKFRPDKGAWSTHNTVSPPSWSPDISEGREIFKPRQLPGSAIWSIKVGRGSGFPGKRRPRGAGLSGRGGRGRSKLKSGMGTVVLPGVSAADISSNKDEEENSMHNTVVLFSSSDKFTLHQDMCVVCGSFGQGAEGRLLACSQCGQCYHPYCVSIKTLNTGERGMGTSQAAAWERDELSALRSGCQRLRLHLRSGRGTSRPPCGPGASGCVPGEGQAACPAAQGACGCACGLGEATHPQSPITKVVLSKGWRCLECTVCEACGKATDPGRLLLCDDCDISYHTYCLDPPLQTVPKGGWKCKWCVWCRHCGATSAGLRCEWQNNYTQCAPCASLSSCPVCCRNYREEDLILQCRQCDRWMHAICQNLNTEEEVENVADTGFDCSMCRPYMLTSNVPSSDCCDSSLVAQIVTKVKELDPPKTYTQDGVCLTESGLTQLQSLIATAPRRKRSKPKLKLKIINQNSVAVLQTPPDIQSEHSRDGELDDSREGELMDCDGKSESSPEREPWMVKPRVWKEQRVSERGSGNRTDQGRWGVAEPKAGKASAEAFLALGTSREPAGIAGNDQEVGSFDP